MTGPPRSFLPAPNTCASGGEILLDKARFLVPALTLKDSGVVLYRHHYKDPGHHDGWDLRTLCRLLVLLDQRDRILPMVFEDHAMQRQANPLGTHYWVFLDDWSRATNDEQELFQVLDMHEAINAMLS